MKGAPWFKFWVSDFRGGTLEMTNSEVGAFVRLLLVQWEQGSLPDDPEGLAMMACGPVSARVLAKFKKGQDGRLRSARMEKEREGATKRSAMGAAGADARWNTDRKPEAKPELCGPHAVGIPDGNADRNAEDRGQSTEDTGKRKEVKEHKKEESSAEPGIPASAPEASSVALWFDCTGKPDKWPLTESQVDEWQDLYTGIDVLAECKHARAWENANPGKRKTFQGHARFLVSWLKRQQDSGKGRRNSPDAKEEDPNALF